MTWIAAMNGAASSTYADREEEEGDDEREHALDRVAGEDHQGREQDRDHGGGVEEEALHGTTRALTSSSPAAQSRFTSASGRSTFQPSRISWS